MKIPLSFPLQEMSLFYPRIHELPTISDLSFKINKLQSGHLCTVIISRKESDDKPVKVESVSLSVMSDSCDPMDCNPPDSSVHGDSPGKNAGVGSHSHVQRIFPAQISNSGLLHFRQILYNLRH